MVEVIHPGWLSIIVDNGRFGYADIGVPWSAALDGFAYGTLNLLLDNDPAAPAIEVMGNEFSLRFYAEASCAITGARVIALLDGEEIASWKSFRVRKGAALRVIKVTEGFRYYVGISGMFDLPKVMGSFSTNIDCRFGGYNGRPLMKGDMVAMKNIRVTEGKEVPSEHMPDLSQPHRLRWIEGLEAGYFREESMKKLCKVNGNARYSVSAKSNRTGIRLEGEPLHFKRNVRRSILSEGLMPGTIQVPPDGMPILALYERVNGGYARPGVIARVDSDRLAHLKPGDGVDFQRITREEALELSRTRNEAIAALHRALGS